MSALNRFPLSGFRIGRSPHWMLGRMVTQCTGGTGTAGEPVEPE